jgi:RNA polymerase sigma-70 factor, ECF subfamily
VQIRDLRGVGQDRPALLGHPGVALDAEDWDRLPARFGVDPAHQAEWGDLFAALRRAVDSELTPRQREVFVAIVLNDVPLDTLVIHLGSSRTAIYKALFDARRKLRAALVANGYLDHDSAGAHERPAGAGPLFAD